MTTTEELSTPVFPEGFHATRLSADVTFRQDGRVKRNQVLAYWNETDKIWTLYRVAKVTNGNPPSWYIVNIEAEPIEGKDGSASTHYADQYSVYSLIEAYSRRQVQYFRVDQERSADFIERYIQEARQRRAERKASAQAWREGPGGIAHRLQSRISTLKYQAAEARGNAQAFDRMVVELEAERELLYKIAGPKPERG